MQSAPRTRGDLRARSPPRAVGPRLRTRSGSIRRWRQPPRRLVRTSPRARVAWGLLGVAAFSVTLPATRVAVASLDPVFVGLGRAVVAACLAADRARRNARAVAAGRALARASRSLRRGSSSAFRCSRRGRCSTCRASHGAVVIGLLPLATAAAGAWLAHERPSRRFWTFAVAGQRGRRRVRAWQGGGTLHIADLLLLGAVASAAIGTPRARGSRA